MEAGNSDIEECLTPVVTTNDGTEIYDKDWGTGRFWLQSTMAGMPASFFCIKAFSETDLTGDLKKFDVPTLILHGDDDQIVPIGASALLSSKPVRGARLEVYKGGSHGMCTTDKDRVNADLLAFIEA